MISLRLPITERTQGRLRRLNLLMVLPVLLVAGVLVTVVETDTWAGAATMAASVLAALVAAERWSANDLGRVALPCLVVAAVAWPVGVLVDSPNAYWGLCVAGSLVVPRLPRHRERAALALNAFVTLVGAGRLLIDDGVLVSFVLVPTGVTIVVSALMFPGERFYELIRDLEQSRVREAELAVVRERVRFAGDLHDIQGHTLHVVKLKAALAQRLVHSDPGRAEEELREIHALVTDTIKQTKELAYAQRKLNLTAELENAKNLFEAAGIRVRVTREAEPEVAVSGLLAQVLRETTTNILRHAQATSVRVTLSERGISIVNDGAPTGPLPELRGLATLRQRVTDEGGALAVAMHDRDFTTTVRFP